MAAYPGKYLSNFRLHVNLCCSWVDFQESTSMETCFALNSFLEMAYMSQYIYTDIAGSWSSSNISWDGALHVSYSFLSCYREMWFSYRRCESSTRLDGKVAIITGANCGIGKFTALDFVRRGEKRIVLEWLLVPFRIWEVPVTNLDSETGSSA
jgi:hypothetical protein